MCIYYHLINAWLLVSPPRGAILVTRFQFVYLAPKMFSKFSFLHHFFQNPPLLCLLTQTRQSEVNSCIFAQQWYQVLFLVLCCSFSCSFWAPFRPHLPFVMMCRLEFKNILTSSPMEPEATLVVWQ